MGWFARAHGMVCSSTPGEEKGPEGKEERDDDDGQQDAKEDAGPKAAELKMPSKEHAGPKPAESGTRNLEAEGSEKTEEEELNKTNNKEEGETGNEPGWKANEGPDNHPTVPGGAWLDKVSLFGVETRV
ncbi:hypothetical protein NDU88_005484 [Pleurodeles waltl]|uniref:Uncharacterized protein n=1 Tax=Pleurodeles waltl TaxID=8319 RepID=A0AAV7L0X0_PLEWA|nr:hypothetical protein NDU88_005484 [Pleurodeles waltl]